MLETAVIVVLVLILAWYVPKKCVALMAGIIAVCYLQQVRAQKLITGGGEFDKLASIIQADGPPIGKYFTNKLTGPVIETVGDIKHRLPWGGDRPKRYADHIGQRKLFMNELQFLTNESSNVCVYAGAAPGHKTFLLSTLFPNMKFILVDPNRFELRINGRSHREFKHPDVVHLSHGYPTMSNTASPDDTAEFIKTSSYKIFILEEFMTNELSNVFAALNCSFISDIRSNIANTTFPSDYDLYWNYSMMFNWISIMKPTRSMIKFRIPYFQDKQKFIKNKEFDVSKKYGIDFSRDYFNKKLTWPKSTLFIQPWAGPSSTEVRSVIHKKDLSNLVTYDILDLEEKLNYYNCIDRPWIHHDNPNADKALNFCVCNDCALENKIWTDYGFDKQQVHKYVKRLGNLTNRPLAAVHNSIFTPVNKEKLILRALKHKPARVYKFKKMKGNKGK